MKTEEPWLRNEWDPRRRALRQAFDEAKLHPASQLRQRRVWLRLHFDRPSPRSQPSRRPAFVWGAATAASLLTVAWLAVPILDDVVLRLPVDEPQPQQTAPPALPVITAYASQDSALEAKAQSIVTGPEERTTRVLPGRVEAQLDANAHLTTNDAGVPEVHAGRVTFTVPQQPPGQRFFVMVAHHRVVVAGTRFAVEATAKRLRVEVSQGVVEVWKDKRLARLAAGESWSLARRPLAPAGVARNQGLLLSPSADESSITDQMVEAARAARSAQDHRQALALYARLAQGHGPAAQNALYEMASLYRDELHDPGRAVKLWRQYRARFPNGLLTMETDVSLVDALASLGDRDSALLEAQSFLRRHPQSERRGEVARVAGDLARSSGDCLAAIEYYEAVLQAQSSPVDRDDATFHRASCLTLMKNKDALKAWQTYLQRHPHGRHASRARAALQSVQARERSP